MWLFSLAIMPQASGDERILKYVWILTWIRFCPGQEINSSDIQSFQYLEIILFLKT
jgi:hypothetical protein